MIEIASTKRSESTTNPHFQCKEHRERVVPRNSDCNEDDAFEMHDSEDENIVDLEAELECLENDLDPENYFNATLKPLTDLKHTSSFCFWDGKCNPWIHSYLGGSGHCPEQKSGCAMPNDTYTNLKEYIEFLKAIKNGQNPNKNDDKEAESSKILAMHHNDAYKAAVAYRTHLLHTCKTDDQRKAIQLITAVIENYYFGTAPTPTIANDEQEVHVLQLPFTLDAGEYGITPLPLIVVIGVPGAGKSWIISQIRTWCEIRLKHTTQPHHAIEKHLLHVGAAQELPDPVTSYVTKCLIHETDGIYGRVAVIAMSGVAAGAVKGFTMHSALKFSVNIKSSVKLGHKKLPNLSRRSQTELWEAWKGVKVPIIDECCTVPVHWLSLIDERLRSIFANSLPFGGIIVILVGDPRQIVPVSGKAFYAHSKYVKTPEDKNNHMAPFVPKYPNSFEELSLRELESYKMYRSSRFRTCLSESIRLRSKQYAALNQRLATYKLSEDDIQGINEHVKLNAELFREPWIDSIWMLPTWRAVNLHVNNVTEYMVKTRGIFRIWTNVDILQNVSEDQSRKALTAFYTSKTEISSTWVRHKSFIDYFPGQIICLKKNWNPTWGLYNNAKGVVVGICFEQPDDAEHPHATLHEIIEQTIQKEETI